VPHPEIPAQQTGLAADSECQRRPQGKGSARGQSPSLQTAPSACLVSPTGTDPWGKQRDIVPVSGGGLCTGASAWWTNSDPSPENPCPAALTDRPSQPGPAPSPQRAGAEGPREEGPCPKPARLPAALTFPCVLPAPRITAPFGARDHPSRHIVRRRRQLRCSRRAPAPQPRELDGKAAIPVASAPEPTHDAAEHGRGSLLLRVPVPELTGDHKISAQKQEGLTGPRRPK